jgi:hypothetical protein
LPAWSSALSPLVDENAAERCGFIAAQLLGLALFRHTLCQGPPLARLVTAPRAGC